ncbi:ChaN family lipoprotein [Thermomonas sp.]|uniref:ChaN family lipoprotein n=1 Tax=Thermomonas sp. TaxID=1971895 RepID=UPI00262244B5|nr:ChaN family lipoprotein [Thermomonas sp.]MCO5054599.1 ChaN family lipoprotein [Thermomonas sp.]
MAQRIWLSLAIAGAVTLGASAQAAQSRTSAAAPEIQLLGEVHDSAAGHAARAELLRAKLEAGWRPAIAMEQFDTEQQPALDAAMRECRDADCVVARVITGKSGWTWDYYKPVITLALEYHLPLYAANLSRGAASKVVKEGFAAALSPELMARYHLDTLPEDVLKAQETEVRDSHCGVLPEQFVTPMAKAQIARDVVMADTLRQHADHGIVLIAGNGHTRGDIAVAYWLRQQGLPAHAVGFIEPDAAPERFDEVHRIPKTVRPDPCAQFQPPKSGN